VFRGIRVRISGTMARVPSAQVLSMGPNGIQGRSGYFTLESDVARWPQLAGASQSRRRCGKGEPSPGADVGEVSPVPVRMWDRVSPFPVQMWWARRVAWAEGLGGARALQRHILRDLRELVRRAAPRAMCHAHHAACITQRARCEM
jgi:hypothetical protein